MTRPAINLSPSFDAGPSEPFAFLHDRQSGVRRIPIEIDRKYRAGLIEAAAKAPRALFHFRNALAAGPDREGAQGAMRYFGNALDLNLKLTAQMVDNLEVAMPGFKRWLEVTGFGNDKNMIKGFVKWAEQDNAAQVEHVLPAVRRVIDA